MDKVINLDIPSHFERLMRVITNMVIDDYDMYGADRCRKKTFKKIEKDLDKDGYIMFIRNSHKKIIITLYLSVLDAVERDKERGILMDKTNNPNMKTMINWFRKNNIPCEITDNTVTVGHCVITYFEKTIKVCGAENEEYLEYSHQEALGRVKRILIKK